MLPGIPGRNQPPADGRDKGDPRLGVRRENHRRSTNNVARFADRHKQLMYTKRGERSKLIDVVLVGVALDEGFMEELLNNGPNPLNSVSGNVLNFHRNMPIPPR